MNTEFEDSTLALLLLGKLSNSMRGGLPDAPVKDVQPLQHLQFSQSVRNNRIQS
jgi:hypothetical protein